MGFFASDVPMRMIEDQEMSIRGSGIEVASTELPACRGGL